MAAAVANPAECEQLFAKDAHHQKKQPPKNQAAKNAQALAQKRSAAVAVAKSAKKQLQRQR